MANINERILPQEINMDLSSLHLGSDKARFIRNFDFTQFAGSKEGENEMVYKPLQSTELLDPEFKLPAGRNFPIGKKVSRETNEVYVFVHNSRQNHCIYRIRNAKCEMVYVGPELKFRLDPRYFIGETQCSVVRVCKGDRNLTYLIWTEGSDNPQRFLCVEDSIATKYFSEANLRFRTKYPREELINLGIRSHNECIGISEVLSDDNDSINKLKYRTWQFRVQAIDVYGRPSEHGVISDLYYQGDCAGNKRRCLDLTFDAGGPMVAKWRIEFRRNCTTEWSYHDTVELYENCEKVWYEKKRNKKIQWDNATNIITYRFCADKECVPVPDSETDRVHNPMPIRSQSCINLAGGIALAGNDHGRKPLGCDVMDRVKFSVEVPDDINPIQIANRTIVVWIQIYNVFNQYPGAIWQQEERTVFGGIGEDGRRDDGVSGRYKQYFGDPEQGGFIGYLAGTGIYGVSEQWVFGENSRFYSAGVSMETKEPVSGNHAWKYYGVVGKNDYGFVRRNYFLQRIEFKNVPPGVYSFRLAGHASSVKDPNFRDTSTYFAGVVPMREPNGRPDSNWIRFQQPNGNPLDRELIINVCDKDYDSMKENQVVQVWDLTRPSRDINNTANARPGSGYVYETRDGVDPQLPMPDVQVFVTRDTDGGWDRSSVWWTPHTDYNGFWFAQSDDREYAVHLRIKRRKVWINREVMVFTGGDDDALKQKDFVATELWPEFQSEACNRIRLRGKITDCITGDSIPNIIVGLKNGAWVTTNSDGEYEIILYEWERQTWPVTERQTNPDNRVFYLAGGKCRVTTCDDYPCLQGTDFIRPVSSGLPTSCREQIVTLPDLKLKLLGFAMRGPQLGGRYGFGIKGADWMDRKGFVNTKPEWYLDIPTVNEMGGFAYPRIRWSFEPGITFPSWVDKVYFNWTRNLKYSDFLSHIVDRLEFIDNTGRVNNVSPTQIRIYYKSLNEYNKQHNFATNTTWQILDTPEGKPSTVRATDTVQFVANGDGSIFPEVITELVRHDKDGSYFLVDYDSRLKKLEEGALIKFMREQDCAESEEFYEICETIPVVDGKPVKDSGYLNVYDSYMVGRQIPVPVVTKVKRRKATETNGTVTYTETEEEETVNTIKNFGWPFEHHSPSDFWGEKCSNRGRVSTKNDYEDIICKGDEIALSGVIGENSNLNLLHYYDTKRMKAFGSEWGNIVGVVAQQKRVLFITDIDHYMVPFDDNAVRVSNQGAIVVSADKQFGKPERAGVPYGCRFEEKGTISIGLGIVHWLDTNENADVYHDFQMARNAADKKFDSFLRPKVKYVRKNKSKFFHSHINPKDGQCYTTDFDIKQPEFVNNHLEAQPKDWNETFAVDIKTQSLRKFCSFTPEMYASLSGDEVDKQFYSFKDALPYTHTRPNPTSFNKFYGFQCQRVMRIAVTKDPLTEHDFMSLEQYNDQVLLWSPEVVSEFKQRSRMPRNIWRRGDRHWIASFLCAENSQYDTNRPKETSVNAIHDGDKLRGRYIEILLIGDPDNLDKYSELSGFILNANV